jgi:hypothetical protein
MNTPRNPYAPPSASLESNTPIDHSGSECWRHNKVMIIERDSEFPPRCIKCNEETDQPGITVKVYWHHWAIYLLILVSVPIYVIVALIVRKTAKVTPFMCAVHRRKRMIGKVLIYSTLLISFGMLIAGLNDMPALLGLSFLLLLIGILVGVRMARTVYAKKIDDRYVQLKGCDAAFLDSLPEFQDTL